MTIAPGWYPDPLAPDAARWWSGEEWTEAVEPIPRQPVPVPTPVPMPTSVPVPTPVPRPVQGPRVPQAPAAFSPAPIVQGPVHGDWWATNPAMWGPPARPARRTPWLVGAVVGLIVIIFLAVTIQVTVIGAAPAKAAATGYLQALTRGDTAAAYQDWCAADRALYPEAVFRAQHEWRAGHPSQVGSALRDWGGNTATVWVNDERDLPMQLTAGRWEVCPHGDRLRHDMANCDCMTPAQELESDIAFVASRNTTHQFVQVTCPAIPALVDGKAFDCTAAAADGRTWKVIATESGGGTYTDLAITPSGTAG